MHIFGHNWFTMKYLHNYIRLDCNFQICMHTESANKLSVASKKACSHSLAYKHVLAGKHVVRVEHGIVRSVGRIRPHVSGWPVLSLDFSWWSCVRGLIDAQGLSAITLYATSPLSGQNLARDLTDPPALPCASWSTGFPKMPGESLLRAPRLSEPMPTPAPPVSPLDESRPFAFRAITSEAPTTGVEGAFDCGST